MIKIYSKQFINISFLQLSISTIFFYIFIIQNNVIGQDHSKHQNQIIKTENENTEQAFKGEKTTAQIIIIKTVPVKMLYDIEEFTVKAGKKVVLIFANNDAGMQHNLIITKIGSLNKVSLASTMMTIKDANKALEKNYIPESPDIIQSIPIVNPGDVKYIEFNAPDQEGEYPYVCTYPGHWMTMKGKMIVKK